MSTPFFIDSTISGRQSAPYESIYFEVQRHEVISRQGEREPMNTMPSLVFTSAELASIFPALAEFAEAKQKEYSARQLAEYQRRCQPNSPPAISEVIAKPVPVPVFGTWIAVADLLPEMDQEVLLDHKQFGVCTGRRVWEQGWDPDRWQTSAGTYTFKDGLVTHWMPWPNSRHKAR